MNPLVDRRLRRSTDPLVALHHQLSSTKSEQGFDALVIADSAGMVMAAVGSWAVCEEIAAYAPLIDRGLTDDATSASERVRSLSAKVNVQRVDVGDDTLLLCSRAQPSGDAPGHQSLERTAQGIRRILEAA